MPDSWWYATWGFREDEPITRYKPCQPELRLKIALKPHGV